MILFSGGGEYLTRYTPLGPGTPPGTPPETRYTPGTRYTHPPRTRYQVHPPGAQHACWEIRSTRGRYASYWNAILLVPAPYLDTQTHCGLADRSNHPRIDRSAALWCESYTHTARLRGYTFLSSPLYRRCHTHNLQGQT